MTSTRSRARRIPKAGDAGPPQIPTATRHARRPRRSHPNARRAVKADVAKIRGKPRLTVESADEGATRLERRVPQALVVVRVIECREGIPVHSRRVAGGGATRRDREAGLRSAAGAVPWLELVAACPART